MTAEELVDRLIKNVTKSIELGKKPMGQFHVNQVKTFLSHIAQILVTEKNELPVYNGNLDEYLVALEENKEGYVELFQAVLDSTIIRTAPVEPVGVALTKKLDALAKYCGE